MSETVQARSMRRWAVAGLCLLLFLSAATMLYFRSTQPHTPRWVDLTVPFNSALLAILTLFSEWMPARRNWRFGVAAFFLLLSAVELFFYFHGKA